MSGYEQQGGVGELVDRTPFAQDAEECVLGAMLMERDAVDAAIELLAPECFYVQAHRDLFAAIIHLHENNMPVDPITLTDQLKKDGKLEMVGGRQFIYDVAGSVPTAANVEHHAEIVAEKHKLRMLRQLCQEGEAAASGVVESASALLDEFEGKMLRIGEDRRRKSVKAADIIKNYMAELEERAEAGGGTQGIKTGFVDLDRLIGGLRETDLCIVAGYTSHGKTAFSLQVALNATRIAPHSQNQVPTAFFTLEMTDKQLVERMTANISGVDMASLKEGKLSTLQWSQLNQAANEIYELPLIIEHVPGISLVELRAKARRLKRTESVGLVIVDYLQKMHTKAESRQQEVSAIVGGLKDLAGEIGAPVIALSQLNREAAKRTDPSPKLHYLRESGSIEQDADQVLFVYRPGKDRQKQEDEHGNTVPIQESEAWLMLEKNRNGPTGRAYANFDGSTQSFLSRSNR